MAIEEAELFRQTDIGGDRSPLVLVPMDGVLQRVPAPGGLHDGPDSEFGPRPDLSVVTPDIMDDAVTEIDGPLPVDVGEPDSPPHITALVHRGDGTLQWEQVPAAPVDELKSGYASSPDSHEAQRRINLARVALGDEEPTFNNIASLLDAMDVAGVPDGPDDTFTIGLLLHIVAMRREMFERQAAIDDFADVSQTRVITDVS